MFIRLKITIGANIEFVKSEDSKYKLVALNQLKNNVYLCNFMLNKQFKRDSARVAFLVCGGFWC